MNRAAASQAGFLHLRAIHERFRSGSVYSPSTSSIGIGAAGRAATGTLTSRRLGGQCWLATGELRAQDVNEAVAMRTPGAAAVLPRTHCKAIR